MLQERSAKNETRQTKKIKLFSANQSLLLRGPKRTNLIVQFRGCRMVCFPRSLIFIFRLNSNKKAMLISYLSCKNLKRAQERIGTSHQAPVLRVEFKAWLWLSDTNISTPAKQAVYQSRIKMHRTCRRCDSFHNWFNISKLGVKNKNKSILFSLFSCAK